MTAVDKLELIVERGELFALLGVNGSGKTTTIKLLSGLSHPDEGDAFILEKSVIKQQEVWEKDKNELLEIDFMRCYAA